MEPFMSLMRHLPIGMPVSARWEGAFHPEGRLHARARGTNRLEGAENAGLGVGFRLDGGLPSG
jgi:hypothetical protein